MSEAPHPTDVQVGRRLRQRRTLLGMSQDRLGELLGVTYQQIQKYERGANRIGSSRLHEISRILAVPVTYFFDEPPIAAPVARGQPGLVEGGSAFVFDGPPAAPKADHVDIDTRETVDLVRAFQRIDDPQVRRRLIELTRALAELSYRESASDSQEA